MKPKIGMAWCGHEGFFDWMQGSMATAAIIILDSPPVLSATPPNTANKMPPLSFVPTVHHQGVLPIGLGTNGRRRRNWPVRVPRSSRPGHFSARAWTSQSTAIDKRISGYPLHPHRAQVYPIYSNSESTPRDFLDTISMWALASKRMAL